MTYMQLATVNYDDLENTTKLNWLKQQIGDEGFVLITDGDESFQRDFEPSVLSLETVLQDVSENESIIFAGNAPDLKGFEKSVSYWGDDKLTKLEN